MSELTRLIEEWEKSAISFNEAERFISMLVREVKVTRPKPPENTIGATHWSILPDDSIVFYKIEGDIFTWSGSRWFKPTIAPYTLHCFDDYESD
ncbi:hypothetical protein [Catenovulum sediminis]|uniref:Uncharacterized protein n=1 Tax=Catenovulum sediminis TaxID=1740262 RepID=A0ABV1RHD5_9ALTE